MTNLVKQGNSLIVTSDNGYPFEEGKISLPFSSVYYVIDESDLVVFKSISNGDILFQGKLGEMTIDGAVVTRSNIYAKFDEFNVNGGEVPEKISDLIDDVGMLTDDDLGTAEQTYTSMLKYEDFFQFDENMEIMHLNIISGAVMVVGNIFYGELDFGYHNVCTSQALPLGDVKSIRFSMRENTRFKSHCITFYKSQAISPYFIVGDRVGYTIGESTNIYSIEMNIPEGATHFAIVSWDYANEDAYGGTNQYGLDNRYKWVIEYDPYTLEMATTYLPEAKITAAISEAIKPLKEDINNLNGRVDTLDTRVDTIQYDKIPTLENKVNELQLYKFPNATIFGQPTIQNGQVSNFSNNNYLQFPFLVDFQNQPFQIDFSFTTGDDISGQQNILDSNFGLAFAIRNGKVVAVASNNGTSWTTGELISNQTLTPNTTYYFRIHWVRGTENPFLSIVGGLSKDDTTISIGIITEPPYPKTMYIGRSYVNNGNYFKGSINLNNASLTIANKVVWTGMDDVGLATRAAVDLSNIDAKGKEVIDARIDNKINALFQFDSSTGTLDIITE